MKLSENVAQNELTRYNNRSVQTARTTTESSPIKAKTLSATGFSAGH